MTTMTRRELLKASATTGLLLGAPAILSAQSKQPINIGTLCPLTGAGGSYGPDMQRSVVAVVERINRAGGIHGRPIQLFHEDDQTNAEAGVRAVANQPGAVVYSYADGAKLLAEGKKINYEGASGSCDFDAIGDILSAPFAVQQVRKGKSELVTIVNP